MSDINELLLCFSIFGSSYFKCFNQNIFYVFYSVRIKLKNIVKSKVYSDTLYMFI